MGYGFTRPLSITAINDLETRTVSFHPDPPWGATEKAFAYRATPIQGLSALPATTATKPVSHQQAKDYHHGTSWSSPSPLPHPELDSACRLRLCSQLLHNFQWHLGVQELGNSTAPASSRGQGPLNQLLLSRASDSPFTTLSKWCLGISLWPSTCLARHGISAVKLPMSSLLKLMCPYGRVDAGHATVQLQTHS